MWHKIELGTSDEVQFLADGGGSGSLGDATLVQLEAVPRASGSGAPHCLGNVTDFSPQTVPGRKWDVDQKDVTLHMPHTPAVWRRGAGVSAVTCCVFVQGFYQNCVMTFMTKKNGENRNLCV